ncbi:hypothetical protein [Moraxella lacunata]
MPLHLYIIEFTVILSFWAYLSYPMPFLKPIVILGINNLDYVK